MQIKISFAAAYDFNQLIHAVCSPPRPLPAPQILTPSPPRIVGKGGVPALPRPEEFWPCPSPPREKNIFPVHPWKIFQNMVWFYTLKFKDVTLTP